MNPKALRLIFRCIEFFIYFTCGILIFYSVAPWTQAGEAIGTTIANLPIIKLLESIPLVGLLFMILGWFLPAGMGVFLWLLCQVIEVTPILLNDPQIYDVVIAQLRTIEASKPDDNDAIAKYQKKITHYFINQLGNLGKYAAIAYIAEVTVNLWHYLPYGNGWKDFVSDFMSWDADQIKWSAFFLMLGSIGIVEFLIVFLLTVWRFFRAMSPRKEKPAQAR